MRTIFLARARGWCIAMIGKAQRDVAVGKQFQNRPFEPAGVSELKSITSAGFEQLDEFAEPLAIGNKPGWQLK